MKCLETDKLIGYAYRLIDEAGASEVRTHMAECASCRAMVEQHQQLNGLLKEWTVSEPTPEFDARVRQAVDAIPVGHGAWGFWGRQWARGLALAALGLLIVAGVAWFTHSNHSASGSSTMAKQQFRPADGTGIPAPVVAAQSPGTGAQLGVHAALAVPRRKSAGATSTDDKDAQAMEDYDLAANFDLLSELPKGEHRVVN